MQAPTTLVSCFKIRGMKYGPLWLNISHICWEVTETLLEVEVENLSDRLQARGTRVSWYHIHLWTPLCSLSLRLNVSHHGQLQRGMRSSRDWFQSLCCVYVVGTSKCGKLSLLPQQRDGMSQQPVSVTEGWGAFGLCPSHILILLLLQMDPHNPSETHEYRSCCQEHLTDPCLQIWLQGETLMTLALERDTAIFDLNFPWESVWIAPSLDHPSGPICLGKPYQGHFAPNSVAPGIIQTCNVLHHNKEVIQGGGW